MAVRELYGLRGYTTAGIDAATTVIPVSPPLYGVVSTALQPGDTTYLALQNGTLSEVVRVVGTDGGNLLVQRGSTPYPAPFGTTIEFVLTSQAILESLGPLASGSVVTGEGIAQVSNPVPSVYVVDVAPPEFVGQGIDVLGVWPDLQFVLQNREGNCCNEDGTGGTGTGGSGITSVQGDGIATAFVNGAVATVRVQNPTFTAGPNISVTGAWPTYTISATAGSGTVASVGVGGGLTLTGSPSVNPVISITNTGVTAGNYGGVGVNARGQITTLPAGFNPVSDIATGNTGLQVTRLGGLVTINAVPAAIGVPGILALADPTDAFDPADATSAASPAVVASALNELQLADVTGANSFTGESASLYTNAITATATSVLLLAGEKALVLAEATVVNSTTPATPAQFGMAIADATNGIIKANRSITQSAQQMSFIVAGPMNTTVSLFTTAMNAGDTVQSYSLSVIKF